MKLLENGFIVLNRKICNWRWYTNANTFRVFIHILLQANYEDRDFENITIKRGQFVSTPEKIGKSLGLTCRQVRTAVNHLKSTNELTSKGHNKYTVFTVVNYDMYQDISRAKSQSKVKQKSIKSQSKVDNETIYNKDNKYNNNPPTPLEGGRSGFFEKLCEAYPKKVSGASKKRAIEIIEKKGITEKHLKSLLHAIDKWNQTEQWTKEGGKYIPSLDNWLERGEYRKEIVNGLGSIYSSGYKSLNVRNDKR